MPGYAASNLRCPLPLNEKTGLPHPYTFLAHPQDGAGVCWGKPVFEVREGA